jgi:hypothetical protein
MSSTRTYQTRTYDLEIETKEYLKACKAKSIVNQTNIKTLNDYVINRKTRNLNASFLANSPIILDGLVLWLDAGVSDSYPTVGTIWKDLAGSNNGTLTNGPTFNSEKGGSIVFDGSNDYVVTSSNNIVYSALTFIAVINRSSITSGGAGIIFNRGGGGSTTGMNIVFPGAGGLGYHWNDDANTYSYNPNLAIPINTWCFCCVSVSPTQAIFQVNNNIVIRSYTNPTTNTTLGGNLQIGADAAAGRYYPAQVAQALIYNRALTPIEIQQNYNATKSRFGL